MMLKPEQLLKDLIGDAGRELTANILPFWMTRMPDNEQGGFYGRIDGRDNIISDAPKGAILNARILWSFSAAFVNLRDQQYLKMATRASDYIMTHFFDKEYGGTYWCLSNNGEPLDTKKQIYSQAFFIYALSWYFMASGDEKCRNKAIDLFYLIERYSFDKVLNGYFEAFDRSWGALDDLRLSAKDANEKKTMNTHLHILEAYTALYRVWPADNLHEKLKNLVLLFTDKIINDKTSHLNLFFDETWECKSTLVSYGHDIEASWLLYEAARVLGDEDIIRRVALISTTIVRAALEGLQDDGSLIYERDDAIALIDHDRHWWVQAEAVVGLLNAWELNGDKSYLEKAVRCFDFIKKRLVDSEKGEWYWSIRSDGAVNTTDDKAGFWKCPYHNSRMCLEIMAREK